MFLENTVNHEEPFGWIEVICGSMFSGKTEELIRRLKRAQFAKQRIEIFKPQVDTRYHDEMVVSHDENEIRFVNLLRSKLELHDEDILSRFGADTMLCINESSGIAKSVFTNVNELRLGLKATELLKPKSQE